MHLRVIGDARQELGRCARSRFRLRIRNRHDGRVRTCPRDTYKKVSCVEVMTAYLDHIEDINPHVNAIVALEDGDNLLARRE